MNTSIVLESIFWKIKIASGEQVCNKDREDTLEKTRARYEELAIQQDAATEAGDHKKANRVYDKLQRIFDSFRHDRLTAETLLTRLLKNNDIRARSWAAAHCLSLKIKVEEAENVLREAANNSEYKFLSFTAKKTLEVWKEQEYLKF